ncbi:MAG: hypothetical protein ACYC18_07575 [Gammaproteobacteria bacterium]
MKVVHPTPGDAARALGWRCHVEITATETNGLQPLKTVASPACACRVAEDGEVRGQDRAAVERTP